MPELPFLDQLAAGETGLTTILALSFVAAAATVLAAGSWVGAQLRRHPDVLQAYEERKESEGLPVAAWHLLQELGAKAAASERLDGMRRKVAKHLVQAGRPPELSATAYLGQGFAVGVLSGLGLAVMTLLFFGSPNVIIAIGAVLAVGLVVWPKRLEAEAADRVRQVSRRLPFAIDLAVLVLEAGGTLGEALNILAEGGEGDPIAEEIRLVLEGQKAGRTQARALQDFAERMELEDLDMLVLAINRGEEMGAAMKDTLRTQSEVIRERRFERAEKIAAEAPVKMMLPNMIIMMATLLVVMGPMLIKIARGDF